MSEFFKGWRRKFGAVTLLSACVFMIGWVRSFSYEDVLQVTLPDRFGGLHAFESSHSVLSWSKVCLPPWYPGEISWSSVAIGPQRETVISELFPQYPDVLSSNPARQWKAPYWSAILLPTLFSAWLLLAKSRKSTAMKMVEPASAEGT